MSYIEKNLMGGEEVVYKGKIHWFIFVPSLFFLVVGIFMIGAADAGGEAPADGGLLVVGTILIFLSPLLFLNALITKLTTELGVTTKRVIAKTGFISRNTVELNHSKVESFNVDQSIFGRIFGYGTLVIQGTGGGKTPIRGIDSPLKFRREAMETIDKSEGG